MTADQAQTQAQAAQTQKPTEEAKHRVSYFYDAEVGCFGALELHDLDLIITGSFPNHSCSRGRSHNPFCPLIMRRRKIGNYHFGQGHPMKPHRIRMTHNLVVNYVSRYNYIDNDGWSAPECPLIKSSRHFHVSMQGLYKKLDVLRPRLLSNTTMTRFHSDEYIDFLRCVTPDNMSDHKEKLQRFGLGEANPIFDGLFEYVQLYTSGSIAGAQRLNNKMCNLAINWSGGMHNAKASEASGFGYVNDCVLSILELLKNHDRVL